MQTSSMTMSEKVIRLTGLLAGLILVILFFYEGSKDIYLLLCSLGGLIGGIKLFRNNLIR